jgi:CheY-like chemotaxis protein
MCNTPVNRCDFLIFKYQVFDEDKGEREASESREPGATFRGSNVKKTKILIADDSENLLYALRIQLEAIYGFEVVTCTNANFALAQAQKHMPDVMVLDIRMDAERHNILSPAGDGLGVLERMEKLPELRGIPVIFITGDQSSQLDMRAKQLGAFGLLHKPIELSELVRIIESAAESRCPQSEADSDLEDTKILQAISQSRHPKIAGAKQ